MSHDPDHSAAADRDLVEVSQRHGNMHAFEVLYRRYVERLEVRSP